MLSSVSGYVYEKRLILKYLNENGTDPMNNQALNPEQLIEVKSKKFFKIKLNSKLIENSNSKCFIKTQATISHKYSSFTKKFTR